MGISLLHSAALHTTISFNARDCCEWCTKLQAVAAHGIAVQYWCMTLLYGATAERYTFTTYYYCDVCNTDTRQMEVKHTSEW